MSEEINKNISSEARVIQKVLELKDLIVENGHQFNKDGEMEKLMTNYTPEIHLLTLSLLEESLAEAQILVQIRQDYVASQRNRIRWIFGIDLK